MAEFTAEQQVTRQKHAAVEVLIGSLATSAKTTSLYKAGHPIILQLAERVTQVLLKTLGQETTLVLDIKAKTITVDEVELTDSPDMTAFAVALHTLGIGQLLFTNRVTKEGMVEFLKVLVAKPDEKTTLTDLQKSVQETRIDGLQMTFILNFVVTGEQEEKNEMPGQLSEEQVQSFTLAKTLPDFLTLLFKQNEKLQGKEAEEVTELLDSCRNRETTLEEFEAAMPWSCYDPRIRTRLEEFAACVRRPPRWKGRPRTAAKGRPRWDHAALVSWAAVLRKPDRESLGDHQTHEKNAAMLWSLAKAQAMLENPEGERQPKYVVEVYGRLLMELGRDGQISALMKEQERWTHMLADPRLAAVQPLLRKLIQEKIASPAVAERIVAHLAELEKDSPAFAKVAEFLAFLGEGVIPLLLGEMQKVQDKSHRAKLCALLAALGRRFGTKALVAALGDEDWFIVANLATVLADVGGPENLDALVPLLKHSHHKVRETVARTLAKTGGEIAVKGLIEYITVGAPEETTKIVIAISLLTHPGLDVLLIGAFAATPHDEMKVAIATALGRLPTNASLIFLKATARRTWYEIITGLNKELKTAARESLETLKKEGRA